MDKPLYPDQVLVKFSTKEKEFLKQITSRIQRENLNLNIPTYYSESYCDDNMRAYLITTYIPYSIEEYLAYKGAKKNYPLAIEIAAKMICTVESTSWATYTEILTL
jgi:hypothetical protein